MNDLIKIMYKQIIALIQYCAESTQSNNMIPSKKFVQ